MSNSNLELFEVDLIKEFSKEIITSVIGYQDQKDNKDHIIIGDSLGNLTVYKKEKSKLIELHQDQLKSKIENIIAIPNSNVLFVLAGGNLYFYDLMNFKLLSKDYDKDFRDISKIAENKNSSKEFGDKILIVTKKKKILFYKYYHEIERLKPDELKDKDENLLSFNLEEIPEKILWFGNHICYYTKSGKIFFIILKPNENNITEKTELSQAIPADNLVYISNSWLALTGNVGLYFDLYGQAISKNTLVFDPNQSNPQIQLIDLKVLNDFHIISLSQSDIRIFENNEGQLLQTLNLENNAPQFKTIFLGEGNHSLFLVTSNKKEEKSKENIYKIWEVREYTLEKQIKLAIKSDQIEKAFNLINNKLEYNLEKFDFLESFYCDCAWNYMQKKTKEGYQKAEIYFGLCNFNPYELIYHFIKLLKIKPIHSGFQGQTLSNEVNNCQIFSDIKNLDENTKAALEMLIKVLKPKKDYILKNNIIINDEKGKVKKKTIQIIKDSILKFDSSQNCPINLENVQPTEIKSFEAIDIINKALINAMVLLGYKTYFIEKIIEEDKPINSYSEEFFKEIGNFTSKMALACINKKIRKYKEAIEILEPYVENVENKEENLDAVNLLKKILIEFGTNSENNENKEKTELFKKGINLLLKNNANIAYEVILYNEFIKIDDILENILPESNAPNLANKRETFLKIVCDDKNYSNEKYQTIYLESLIKKIFAKRQNSDIPKQKEDEKDFPKAYLELKEIIKKYDKYDKTKLLNCVKNTWMYDIEIYLLSKSKKNDEAIKCLINLTKTGIKTFENIREFCKNNYSDDTEIFKKYFHKLKEQYDDKENKDTKLVYKKEMLKIIDLFINGELLDKEEAKNKNKLELLNVLNPKEILALIPSDWKLNELLDEEHKDKNNRTIFNLMHFYLKEYTIINNNYKRMENLAKMDLIYKQKQLFELRDKHIALDVNSCCYLCGKKIVNNIPLMIYPNGHIYHAKCSPDINIETKTGKNFKNFDY